MTNMKEISADTLKNILIQKRVPVLIVDVRETDEAKGEPLLPIETRQYAILPLSILAVLPKEELFVRLEKIAERAGTSLHQARWIVSCRSGNRSRRAQGILAQHGIESENLSEGYLGW